MRQTMEAYRSKFHEAYLALDLRWRISLLLILGVFWFWWCFVWTEHLLKNDVVHARYPFWVELSALSIGVLYVVGLTCSIILQIMDGYIFEKN